MISKKLFIIWLTLIAISAGSQAQITPTPMAAFIGTGSPITWSAWTSASGSGALVYTPTAIGLYCQANPPLGPWTPCSPVSSTGTVTSFSSGNLAPLFTTTVANSTTTPAQSFVASTSAQNSVLAGPATGGTGAYSFRALVAADIPSLAYIPTSSAPAGSIVGTTDTQTLTNKTLAPTTIVNGDATSTPSTTQWVTSTNSGLTAGITAGKLCRITQILNSGTSYYGSADCTTQSPGEQWYFSPSNPLNSPVWASTLVFSTTTLTIATPISGLSFAGMQTATFVAGAAAGTGPTVACVASHSCDSFSGEITLTTGTVPTTGTLLTITLGTTRTNIPNCQVSVTTSSVGEITTDQWAETTTTIVITANVALTLSTAYTVSYICGGR